MFPLKRVTAPIGMGVRRICTVEGCTEKHEARGWCEAHYNRWLRHGDPLPEKPVRRRVVGGGLSESHIRIWRQLVIGGSDKEIAQRTGLALKTVKNALSELYGVLELNPQRTYGRHSRTVATLWGMEIMSHHPEVFKDAERRNQ